MIGYPYTYSDYLSEEEAMQRRVDIFDRLVDKGLVLVVFWSVWSLIPNTAFAVDLPADRGLAEAPKAASDSNPAVFAPIVGVCKCTSPQVKTAILLVGISSICYSALCSKDKALIIACSSLATYAATQLGK
jgi:hypothetical protein